MKTDNILFAASATILVAAFILAAAAFLLLEVGTFDFSTIFAIP